jgi:very-short-patch-repair endonuclease
MPNPRARQLRRNQTEAEKTLWRLLRNRRFEDQKFRRQHPIGPYIADFACLAARLVIEADGGQHSDTTKDTRRTAWLHQDGWHVLRFWNTDILQNQEHVLTTIEAALSRTLTLTRSG